MTTPIPTELFFQALDDYFDSVDGLSWDDLASRQEGLTASLAFGAAGLAHAHVEAGLRLDDPELLDRAALWVERARGHAHERDAFLGAGAPAEMKMPEGSWIYGPLGLAWVDARLAEIRGDGRRQEAVSRFVETARHALEGTLLDLYRGVAGALVATAGLLRRRRDPRLVDLAHELFRRLDNEARETDGVLTWPGLSGPGLAHGAAGAHLGLLLGAQALQRAPTPELARSLARWVRRAVDAPETVAREEHRGWLCTGFPGLAYVTARAHRSFGHDELLDVARRAAEIALAHPPLRPDLCCGRLGVAAACLAVAARDPAGPWRRHAREHAASALLCDWDEWPVAGLLGGPAALPCLALDLISEPREPGFPGFEPSPTPVMSLRVSS